MICSATSFSPDGFKIVQFLLKRVGSVPLSVCRSFAWFFPLLSNNRENAGKTPEFGICGLQILNLYIKTFTFCKLFRPPPGPHNCPDYNLLWHICQARPTRLSVVSPSQNVLPPKGQGADNRTEANPPRSNNKVQAPGPPAPGPRIRSQAAERAGRRPPSRRSAASSPRPEKCASASRLTGASASQSGSSKRSSTSASPSMAGVVQAETEPYSLREHLRELPVVRAAVNAHLLNRAAGRLGPLQGSLRWGRR